MLCNGIFGVLNRWCDATLVNYMLVAIFLWRTVSLVRCIFGVMCMHFWYAMHRHLWWCLVGVITIVQCIFGALFLGLGCNIFLVLRLWCYALPAIWRRLATAVAHLLYKDIMHGNCCDVYSAKEIIRMFLFFCFLSTAPDLKRDPSPPTHKKPLTPIFSLRNPIRKK